MAVFDMENDFLRVILFYFMMVKQGKAPLTPVCIRLTVNDSPPVDWLIVLVIPFIIGVLSSITESLTCFSVMTWSWIRQCKTLGNFSMGNLWLAGRSHTYRLWWTTGSPLESGLTCQVNMSAVRSGFIKSTVFTIFSETVNGSSHYFSVETSAGTESRSEQPADLQTSSFTEHVSEAGHVLCSGRFCVMKRAEGVCCLLTDVWLRVSSVTPPPAVREWEEHSVWCYTAQYHHLLVWSEPCRHPADALHVDQNQTGWFMVSFSRSFSDFSFYQIQWVSLMKTWNIIILKSIVICSYIGSVYTGVQLFYFEIHYHMYNFFCPLHLNDNILAFL